MRSVAVVLAIIAVACDGRATQPAGPTAASPSFALPTASTTFNFTGSVHDIALRPVADAKVEIVDGSLAGRFTTTDASGRFAFAALTPATEMATLRVTKDGYVPYTTSGHNNGSAIVTLTALGPIDLEGEFRITFTAADTCGGIPAALRARTYNATIRHTAYGPGFTIELGGADFFPGYRTFSVVSSSDAVRFNVFSWDAANRWLDDLPIFERVDSTTYLSIMGVANATVGRADASIAAILDGSLSYCAAATEPSAPDFPPTCAVALAECKSNVHQLSAARTLSSGGNDGKYGEP